MSDTEGRGTDRRRQLDYCLGPCCLSAKNGIAGKTEHVCTHLSTSDAH